MGTKRSVLTEDLSNMAQEFANWSQKYEKSGRTDKEAGAQDAGQAGAAPIQITITGNYFTGTPEEMADQLAEIIVRKVVQAATAAAPK